MLNQSVIKYHMTFTPSCTLDQLSSNDGTLGAVFKKDKNGDIFNYLSENISSFGDKIVGLVNRKEFNECSLVIVPIDSIVSMDKSELVQVGYWGNPVEDGIHVSDVIYNSNTGNEGFQTLDAVIFDSSFIKVSKWDEVQGNTEYSTNYFDEDPNSSPLIEPCLEIIKIQLLYLHALCTHQRFFHIGNISQDKNFSLN
ncbi:hypothetical protein [Proteus mirabilis]|uniref:hypothetical protein n=1 Tax=Proteus mirabilis TaxID=584 RepID=UPI0034D68D33